MSATSDEDEQEQEPDAGEADGRAGDARQEQGMPATMPPKMISEMPLPMPFSVMSSPSQTRNIVPAVMEASGRQGRQRLAAREADVADHGRRAECLKDLELA